MTVIPEGATLCTCRGVGFGVESKADCERCQGRGWYEPDEPKVYVLYGEAGQYSDAHWWPVSTHRTRKAAEAKADRIAAWIAGRRREYDAALDRGEEVKPWHGRGDSPFTIREAPPEDPGCQPEWCDDLNAIGAVYTVIETELED